jgi:outer membrane lipoprotein SlyB
MQNRTQNRWVATLTATFLGLCLSVPATATQSRTKAQKKAEHARAKREVESHDAQHHNKLKTEAIPTAGGAVAGGVVAGPAGAFAGAKMGHTVGTVFHGVKKHRGIKRVEKRDRARSVHRRAVARRRAATRSTYTRRTLQ